MGAEADLNWRTSDRSAAAPSAGHAWLSAADERAGHGPCAQFGHPQARAVSAAGLTVIECEQPARKVRRGKGKSDSIDAHLVVLTALQLDSSRLPVPRADGDREALQFCSVPATSSQWPSPRRPTGCAGCC